MAFLKLISPLLSSGYLWGGVGLALGGAAVWIYLNGRANGKEAERKKALKQEIKEKEKYEKGYNDGLNMSDSERTEWVRRFTGKDK